MILHRSRSTLKISVGILLGLALFLAVWYVTATRGDETYGNITKQLSGENGSGGGADPYIQAIAYSVLKADAESAPERLVGASKAYCMPELAGKDLTEDERDRLMTAMELAHQRLSGLMLEGGDERSVSLEEVTDCRLLAVVGLPQFADLGPWGG